MFGIRKMKRQIKVLNGNVDYLLRMDKDFGETVYNIEVSRNSNDADYKERLFMLEKNIGNVNKIIDFLNQNYRRLNAATYPGAESLSDKEKEIYKECANAVFSVIKAASNIK